MQATSIGRTGPPRSEADQPQLKRGAISNVGGTVLMLVARRYKPGFFRRERRMVAGDKIVTVTPEAEFAPADSML